MKAAVFFSYFLTSILLSSVNSYKILSLFTQCSKSHVTGYLPLASELASRGHEVTLLHPFENLAIPKKIKSILVPSTDQLDTFKAGVMQSDFSKKATIIFHMRDFTYNGCKNVLQSQPIKDLLKAGKQYDVVIINSLMNECPLAISPLLGNYTILHSAGILTPMLPNPAPSPPSVVPNPVLGLTSKMNFQERFLNFVVTVGFQLIYKYYVTPAVTPLLQEFAPGSPTVMESWKKLSLYIVNQDVITVSPRPSVPNIIALPGVSCRPAKPLPKDLEDFMQSSENDGVIIFGLGSFAESRYFPTEKRDALLKVFSQLKQKVLWKYEDDTLKTPPNVKIMNWLPQQDLLGHPKTKLFISHGGLASMQEAVYHNVPVVGIPLYADQPGNVARMKELGIGEILDFETLTEENIYATLTKILSDKSYYEKMSRYSAIFKDVIQPPAKKGAFWVEYVVRHNGARHLRTLGEDMCLIQYFLIDVIALLTITPLVALYTFYRVTKFAWRKLKNCKRCQKADKKKKQ